MTMPPAGYTGSMRRLIAISCICLLAGGCGGSRPRASGPRVPHALAYRLAGESDALASALDRGDGCAAQAAAARLRTDLTASIAQVPTALQEPLSNRVNDIAAAVPACAPPAPAAKPPKKGKQEKHGKHGKHGGEGGD
jgi:hypothetical protein